MTPIEQAARVAEGFAREARIAQCGLVKNGSQWCAQENAATTAEEIATAIRALSPAVDGGEVERALLDPAAVHVNMLRGSIANPSPAAIWHLYGDAALIEAMPETARAVLSALGREG